MHAEHDVLAVRCGGRVSRHAVRALTEWGEDEGLEPKGGKRAAAPDSKKLGKFGVIDGKPSDLDAVLASADMNDSGNARRFIEREGDGFRHVRQRGWHAWDGVIWNGDIGEELALKGAMRTARAVWAEVQSLGKESGRRGFLIDHAQKSGNISQLRNMLEAALPDLSLSLDECDAHPELIYLPNAVLRLFPSQLEVTRSPGHYVTKLARARYEPDAQCPKWEKFIDEIFPEPSLRDFVQRALGYSATGDMSEEAFFLCWGMGRNGKGTFLRTVAYVLGTYAATIPIELLLKKQSPKSGNEAEPQLSQLPGCRFVITTEPGPGVTFDEGFLQTLTGRDHIRIRDMYGKPFEMVPQFHLWIAANDRPSVRSSSNAYWRRVKSIPFVANIAEEAVIRYLERELHAEASGIFNWMMEGAGHWADKGLAPPLEVTQANQSYRDEMDPLHRFLAECVAMRVQWSVQRKDLIDAYHEWCIENREEPMKDRAFGLAMSSKGYRRKHSNGTVYSDIELTEMGSLYLSKAVEKAKRPVSWGGL
jgi:putative DNA primase/helicase